MPITRILELEEESFNILPLSFIQIQLRKEVPELDFVELQGAISYFHHFSGEQEESKIFGCSY
ncbi:hypothetical protein ACFLWY_05040 [Chloroflexota bacterium]